MQNFNVSPYFDDYNELKGYIKLLFRPGLAVQSRELTQIQSTLQNQIANLGDYIFDEGSEVLGGETKLDLDYKYTKIASVGADIVFGDITVTQIGKWLTSGNNIVLTGGTTGMKALLVKAIDVEGTDPITIYMKYLNSGTNGETKAFARAEVISAVVFTDEEYAKEQENAGAGVATASFSMNVMDDATASGTGSAVSITAGSRYVGGYFINVDSQTIILDKYSNKPTADIGLRIVEDIITPETDPSLLDIAQGYPNYAAPGAHRYRIRLILSTKGDDAENFVRVLTVANGETLIDLREAQLRKPGIEKELAKRMYDTNGNFTVEDFKVEVREHLNDEAGNRGMFTVAEGGDETKLVLDVDAGRAYVYGYEVKTTGSEFVVFDKARDTFTYNNAVVGASYDSYCVINTLTGGMPHIKDFGNTVQLKDNTSPTPLTIGTARVRNLEVENVVRATPTPDGKMQNASTWRLYLFDIKMNSGKVFDNVFSVTGVGQNSEVWSAAVTGTVNKLVGRTNSVPAEQLPFSVVRKIEDITYNVRRQKGVISTKTGAGPYTYTIEVNSDSNSTFEPLIVGNYSLHHNAGNIFVDLSASGVMTLSSNFRTLTITFTLTDDLNASDFVLTYTINKNNADDEIKIKTKVNLVENISTGGGGTNQTYSLGKPDAIKINSIKIGTQDVTDKFTLDNGQRDGFYDDASIVSVAGYSVPASSTLVVDFDFFQQSGSGDYFTAQSYDPDDFESIPTFVSSFGETINLRDAIDFRPYINSSNFGDLFIPASQIRGDIEYYLNRIDKVTVDENGQFSVIRGAPALVAVAPPTPNTGMTIFELTIPAYTFDPKDVKVEYIQNKRYTMKDIGQLEKRIETLEYYTSLNLLEQTTNNKIFKDSNGDTRFKNGFLVDAFAGHGVGDVNLGDYACAIDAAERELRPEANAEFIEMVFDPTNSSDYRIEHETGIITPFLTLPYTEVALAEQKLASTPVNVNPYAIFTWEGELKLTPSSDMWIDIKRLPNIVVNREGQLDNMVVAEVTRNAEASYRTWFSWWNNNWFGVSGDVSSVFTSANDSGGRPSVTTTSTSNTIREVNRARPHSTGQIRLRQVTRTVSTIKDDRIVDITAVPFMRSREVGLAAKRMRPNTRLYASFDGVDVSAYCSPQLLTDASGDYNGTFTIPDPNDNDPLTPQFRTGKRRLILSDDPKHQIGEYTTIASAIYEANGAIETKQSTIITYTNQVDRIVQNWYDPLAQSFIVDNEIGCFVTGVELFFASKDSAIPVTVEIRNMINGYPGRVVAPLSQITLKPDQVNVSEDGSVGTFFRFDAPVFLQPTEYCFMVSAMSTKYTVWTAEMGKVDLLTNETIVKQPFAGVLFKSQNASTWTADQTSDMKFTLKRASFDTTKTAIVEMYNDNLPFKLLESSPIFTTEGSEIITVKCPSHNLAVGSYVEMVCPHLVNGLALSKVVDGQDVAGIWEVTSVQHEYYTAKVKSGQTGIGNTSGATLTGWAGNDVDGNPAVLATKDYGMDLMKLSAQQMAVVGGDGDGNPKTSIFWQIRATKGKSVDGEAQQVQYEIDSNFIDTDTNGNFIFDEPRVITTRYNEQNQSFMDGDRSAIVRAELNSISEFVSPVINLSRVGITAVSNRTSYPSNIDDELLDTMRRYDPVIFQDFTVTGTAPFILSLLTDIRIEDAITVKNTTTNTNLTTSNYSINYTTNTITVNSGAVSGNSIEVKIEPKYLQYGAATRYITRAISLNDSAEEVKVVFDAYRPTTADIKVYIKKLDADTDAKFNLQPWVELNQEVYPKANSDMNEFSEYTFGKDFGSAGAFNLYAIKIIMRAKDSSSPPRIRDFRTIALT